MNSYIIIYRAGPDPIPEDKAQENRQAWRTWSINLQEKYGIHTSSGKTVLSDGTLTDYNGDFRGASMIEAESLQAATDIAKNAPNLPYGGSVDVLEEYSRS